MKQIDNLVSVTKNNNIVITPENDKDFFLSYLRNNINVLNEKDKKEFIMGTERIIRKSKDYSRYIAHLKETIPQCRSCALFNNITDEMAPLEMHHGPVFTLAEICVIVLNHFLKNGKEIDSFDIADQILEDHFDNLIQTIFLSEMAHKPTSNAKTSKNSFISMDHSIGDIVGFIKKYNDAITYYEINKLRNYIYLSELYEKNQGVSIFDYMKESIKSFKNSTVVDGGR